MLKPLIQTVIETYPKTAVFNNQYGMAYLDISYNQVNQNDQFIVGQVKATVTPYKAEHGNAIRPWIVLDQNYDISISAYYLVLVNITRLLESIATGACQFLGSKEFNPTYELFKNTDITPGEKAFLAIDQKIDSCSEKPFIKLPGTERAAIEVFEYYKKSNNGKSK